MSDAVNSLARPERSVNADDLAAIEDVLKKMTPSEKWLALPDVVATADDPPITFMAADRDIRFLATALLFMPRLVYRVRQLEDLERRLADFESAIRPLVTEVGTMANNLRSSEPLIAEAWLEFVKAIDLVLMKNVEGVRLCRKKNVR